MFSTGIIITHMYSSLIDIIVLIAFCLGICNYDTVSLQFQALECFPEVFDHIKLKDFMHAYALG